MAWTQADRDALKAAIAKGEKQVAYADRSVTYRSLDEMTQALALIESDLSATSSTPRPKRWLGYSGGKGI
jgi:hypothetical protein